MTIASLTDWLRGPVFWAALTFMVLGLGRHLVITLWGVVRTWRQAGDKSLPTRQVIGATLRWIFLTQGLKNRLLYGLNTLIFHISIILVPIFLAGHIALWEQAIGISWPALPNGLSTALTITAVITAVTIVIQRVVFKESRRLSRFQDFIMPLIVALPFASGFMLMHPAWNPFSYQFTLFLHVLTGDLIFFLIPITKLSHIVLLPSTQLVSELAWHWPSESGSRVGETLGKVNEPI